MTAINRLIYLSSYGNNRIGPYLYRRWTSEVVEKWKCEHMRMWTDENVNRWKCENVNTYENVKMWKFN